MSLAVMALHAFIGITRPMELRFEVFNGGKKSIFFKMSHLWGSEVSQINKDLKPDSPMYWWFDDGQFLSQSDFSFFIEKIFCKECKKD